METTSAKTTKPEKKTRNRTVTVTDESLSIWRENESDTPSPYASFLRSLPDEEAKRQIQRTENTMEKNGKGKLADSEVYQTALKFFNKTKNTFYRLTGKLSVDEKTGLDGFQRQILGLEEKKAEILKERSTAAADAATGRDKGIPEGKVHAEMRKAQERKRALARQVMDLNGTDTPTPDDILTDGE
jgi:hypothetical protein